VVTFFGKKSTCEQVLARARAEFSAASDNLRAIKQGISEIKKGAKEAIVKIAEAGEELEEDIMTTE
jgi:hypothetical protein